MTTTTKLHRPEPLKDFLDRGGNPRDELGDGFRFMFDDMREALIGGLESRATAWREYIEQSLLGNGGNIPLIEDQDSLIRYAWDADMIDDPTLAERMREFMTADEATQFAYQLDCARKPHPLELRRPYRHGFKIDCDGCGHVFTSDELAMHVGYREGWSAEVGDSPLAWCYGCMTMVTEAMKAARRD